jgi:ferric-dicitrate binding protein FerR (iron transport regulator)
MRIYMNKYINRIIELFTKHELNSHMRETFHEWLIHKEYTAEKEDALRRLWNQTESAPTAGTMMSFSSLKLKFYFNTKKKQAILAVWKYAAAIVCMISATTAYLFTDYTSQKISFAERFVGAGQIDTLLLPDGSAIVANSGSIILYPGNFGNGTRTLYLSGEANFKVVKNPEMPFIVKSKHASVMALGTEFNVSTYADDQKLKVTLISGSIKVETLDTQTDFILDDAGEQFVYHTALKQYAINQVDTGDETAWQRGELVFRGNTLREILTTLERKYGVSFQYKSSLPNEDKYNFHFKRETALPEIMSIIETVAGKFDYTITYNNIKN